MIIQKNQFPDFLTEETKKVFTEFSEYMRNALENSTRPRINQMIHHLECLNQTVDLSYFNFDIVLDEQVAKMFAPLKDSINSVALSQLQSINEAFSLCSEHANKAILSKLKKLPDRFVFAEDTYQHLPVIKDSESDEEIPISYAINTFGILDVLSDISEDEMFEFYHHLCKFPMLGLYHPIGQKVLGSIMNFSGTEYEKLRLFRARKRERGQQHPYPEQAMFEPPYGVSTQGRYNIHGSSVLYTCSSQEGAVAEVRPSEVDIIDVCEWTLIQKVRLLDLEKLDCPLINYCKFSATSSYYMKPEYLVPNFLSQCCQLAGFEGLCFKSDLVDAVNYVFFDPRQQWFKKEGAKSLDASKLHIA